MSVAIQRARPPANHSVKGKTMDTSIVPDAIPTAGSWMRDGLYRTNAAEQNNNASIANKGLRPLESNPTHAPPNGGNAFTARSTLITTNAIAMSFLTMCCLGQLNAKTATTKGSATKTNNPE